jgi:hypothetical protein
MLLKIDGEKIALVGVVVGLIFLVGYAQSRFDVCKSMGHKTISCVFAFD